MIPGWFIDGKRVTVHCNHPFFNILFDPLINAVTQLGVDPHHHKLDVKPNQLLIYETGQGHPYIHLFNEKPEGMCVNTTK